MEERSFKFLGFEIKRKSPENEIEKKTPALVPKDDEDGSGNLVTSGAGYYGQYVDIDGDKAKDNYHLIMKYRAASVYPEVDLAIAEIVNEAIVPNNDGNSVELILDNVETNDSIKEKIKEEFDNVLALLDFTNSGQDIFRRWYVDGRIVYQLLVDEKKPKLGIQEVRYLDGSKVRKVREITYKADEKTGAKIVDKTEEFFLYQENPGLQATTVKLTPESISFTPSGVLDETRKKIISYLHKALKPTNQLKMMEDSLVIYRLARAPERRIFYIDVGNLPKGKAEEYMKNIMAKYRNKLVYDQSTGEIRDDRKHMSMLEDFWLPRKEGGRGTEISTLAGGENLGQIDDVLYFQKRLYRSLNVPPARIATEDSPFNIGRSTEISREEVKFQKFINALRRKFSKLFLDILKTQLILKGIITDSDWEEWKSDIVIDYLKDNHFEELKEAEVLKDRLDTLNLITEHVGVWFTKEYVMKNVLKYTDEEIEKVNKEYEETKKDRESEDDYM